VTAQHTRIASTRSQRDAGSCAEMTDGMDSSPSTERRRLQLGDSGRSLHLKVEGLGRADTRHVLGSMCLTHVLGEGDREDRNCEQDANEGVCVTGEI
jgi:hypothetical protein